MGNPLAVKGLRRSRTPRRRNLDIKDKDLEIEKGQAGLPQTQLI